MTHSEIKAVFEKKIADALVAIKSAKNGDMLSINTSLSYIDDNMVERPDYNGDPKRTSSVAKGIL